MKNILYLAVLMVFGGCFYNRPVMKIERSNINEYTEMKVIFSKDTVRYGDTLDIEIEIKNVSDSTICLFRDAAIWIDNRDTSSHAFVHWDAFFLAGAIEMKPYRVSVIGEDVEPQGSMVFNYKVAIDTLFFLKCRRANFGYRAFLSKYVVDQIECYEYLFPKVIGGQSRRLYMGVY